MQSEEAAVLIQDLTDMARREGREFLEVLEDGGFLLTATRRRQIASEAIRGMLFILERETAERLLRAYLNGRPATAQDMFDAMVRWVQDYRNALEAGHVS